MILVALDDQTRSISLIETVQKHFPNLTILARARGRVEAYEILDKGIQNVYRETFDTSLQMGVDALRALGFRAHQAHRAAQKFRRHDEASLRELAALRHDRGKYLSAAREHIDFLEQTMLQDLTEEDNLKDLGWDAASLRDDADSR